MSANIEQPLLQDALRHDGGLRFIRKPFDVDDLVQTVHHAMTDQVNSTAAPDPQLLRYEV